MQTCLLCKHPSGEIDSPKKLSRTFYHCEVCDLIFAEPAQFLQREEEKHRYEQHKNGIEFQGYVDFLNQAIAPALPLLNDKMHGLDFGCGPNPTLSVILRQHGISCDNYDPLFFNEIPQTAYDFIFATECFEHFFDPQKEITCIQKLLKPQGLLIIMTEKWETLSAFPNWYYIKDTTHVCFFHSKTMDYIATRYGFELLDSQNPRVTMMRKINPKFSIRKS